MTTSANTTLVDGDPDVLKVAVLDDNADTINHGAVTVTSTATLVRAASPSRVSLIVQNLGDAAIYIGGSGVTTANGIAIEAGASLGDLLVRSAVYAITASGTCNVRWLEEAL